MVLLMEASALQQGYKATMSSCQIREEIIKRTAVELWLSKTKAPMYA